jgi:type II secretory pathway component PulF
MVTPAELNRRSQLYSQLAAMIAAGLPLQQALEMAGRDASLRSSRATIGKILAQLREGHTFTDSMKRVKGWLPDFDVTMLSVGEQTGRLDQSFKLLARYYESRAKIIRDMISGLFITIATLHVFLFLFPLPLFVAFVIGLINNKYSDCYPFLLEKVIVFGALYGTVGFFMFMCQGNHGENWRARLEAVYSKIPILRLALKYLSLARLASALEALNNAGVNVLTSWELAGGACGSARLRRAISEQLPQVAAGLTPAEMVANIGYFPEMFRNLYHSAEISGKQDETLARLHAYYEDEGFRKLQTFTRVVNAIIYGSIALTVAITVIRFYVGYFNAALNAF